jgi:protoporphyrinogen oxidase
MEKQNDHQVIILGGGPAGLTAAYELTKHDVKPMVFEQSNKLGGISRTETYKGFHFDMGGHRFFTKVSQIHAIWEEVLKEDFTIRTRLSRIYYNNRFFMYPLKPFNALFNLGIWQSFLAVTSFIYWQIFPYKFEETFEQWVTNRFGKRLYLTFFKTYTEKVWGIPCSELKAEWAAQRIKDLSLKTAIISMFFKPQNTIKTLIESFHYPRQGPGMLWQRMGQEVSHRGGQVQMSSEAVRFIREGDCITAVEIAHNGNRQLVSGSHFISSMPLTEFIKRLDPAPVEILNAAKRLHYRDFLTVCLIIKQPDLFPDNWIYVHAPQVKVGRIQNFKNWSPEMVPDQSMTSLGLEYFCTEGDDVWTTPDEELIELGRQELQQIGLCNADDVVDGCVFRVQKAYPIYDSDYVEYLEKIKTFVTELKNFQTIGRNGLHRYNNQDHSMMTGILAVRNYLFGEKNDLWSVNTDKDYHEEVQARPADLEKILRQAIPQAFPRLDPIAFGLSLGITSSIVLFVSTLFLLLRGGEEIGPRLALLGQFFPGFQVSVEGSFIGMAYVFVIGFIAGSATAHIRNLSVFLNAVLMKKGIEWRMLRRFLDYT